MRLVRLWNVSENYESKSDCENESERSPPLMKMKKKLIRVLDSLVSL